MEIDEDAVQAAIFKTDLTRRPKIKPPKVGGYVPEPIPLMLTSAA